MENKEIIIGDVDVSGCKDRYLGYIGSSCQNTGPSCPDIKCENNKDCYYKQLKRKEQKCEELKNDKFALELRLDELTSPVNVKDCEHSVFNGEYIACRYYEGQRCDDADFANCMFRENVRLKQQLDQLKRQHKDDKGLITSTGKMNYQLIQEYDKLKNCLTEIKEIAEQCRSSLYGYDQERFPKQILQKISEVENE